MNDEVIIIVRSGTTKNGLFFKEQTGFKFNGPNATIEAGNFLIEKYDGKVQKMNSHEIREAIEAI